MARVLIELALTKYHAASFDEAAWRRTFDGIELCVESCQSGEEFLRQREMVGFYNPDIQREDASDDIFLITPIWSDDE